MSVISSGISQLKHLPQLAARKALVAIEEANSAKTAVSHHSLGGSSPQAFPAALADDMAVARFQVTVRNQLGQSMQEGIEQIARRHELGGDLEKVMAPDTTTFNVLWNGRPQAVEAAQLEYAKFTIENLIA